MSATGTATRQIRTRAVVWLSIGAGLLLLLIANSHLVYVAVMRNRNASHMCARARAPRRMESSARHDRHARRDEEAGR